MSDGFHYMYPTGQFGGAPMASMGGYAGGVAAQALGAPGDHQQLSMMQQYAHSSLFNKPAGTAATPVGRSSRITNDPNSIVYYHNGQHDCLSEHSVDQMVTGEGVVYVEHIPGYSLVYVPNDRPIDQILGGVNQPARASHASAKNAHGGHAARGPRTSKPSNAFIMYRNFKIKELRESNPDINQVDISRMAGEHWKTECDEVKNEFKEKYRLQKLEYDQKKVLSKRTRSDTMGASDDDAQSVLSETGPYKRSKHSALGLGLSAGAAAGKPRSRTLPSSVLSSATSRVDFAADLRRHVAARNSSAFLNTEPPFDSTELHQAYAELSASASMANSPSLSIMSAGYMPSEMPALSLGGVPGFSAAAAMTTAEQGAIYAGQHAMGASVDPATLGTPDHADMTSSFINAGIAAGINTMPEASQALVASSDAGELAAAASAATNNVLTSDFYQDTQPPADAQPPADSQWEQQFVEQSPNPPASTGAADSYGPSM
ncbi:hypothetical protein LPJ63_000582 [Coemansia sp. RSA 2711]|nr:hypothetical protein LPJ63_000582 [Coemansia sp. RSA 2711]KAJ1848279.1 hypothetical protein LPJ70_001108 [Coemansia sp. RSA 2708]